MRGKTEQGAAFAAAILMGTFHAAAQEAAPLPADPSAGIRVVHVGNSHSHTLRFLAPLAWRGTERNAEDTRGFGSIILSERIP